METRLKRLMYPKLWYLLTLVKRFMLNLTHYYLTSLTKKGNVFVFLNPLRGSFALHKRAYLNMGMSLKERPGN